MRAAIVLFGMLLCLLALHGVHRPPMAEAQVPTEEQQAVLNQTDDLPVHTEASHSAQKTSDRVKAAIIAKASGVSDQQAAADLQALKSQTQAQFDEVLTQQRK